jgi:hypothetical protein
MTRIERSWARILDLDGDFPKRDVTFLATHVVRLDQELKRLREEVTRMGEHLQQLERDVAGKCGKVD